MTSPLYKSPIPLNYLDTDTALTANSDVKVPTQKAVKAYADTKAPALGADDNYVTDAEKASLASLSGTNTGDEVVATQAEVATGTDPDKMVTPLGLSKFHIPPEGFLYNGKIVPSVASNNLTVAIKGLDGNNPSATNPVYVRIGDTVRSITSALSITRNAGTNWAYAGSAEMATKEIDWFVYLHYYPDTATIYLFLSRICHPRNFVDFPNFNSATDCKTALHSGAVANATDDVCVIGRFGATLSAGAGYTWSVPTFTATNLVQRPIYETRWLSFAPTLANGTSSIAQNPLYKLIGDTCKVQIKLISNTSNSTGAKSFVAPFTLKSGTAKYSAGMIAVQDNNSNLTTPGHLEMTDGSATVLGWKGFYEVAWTNANSCTLYIDDLTYPI